LSAHLVNTLLMLGAMALTAWWGSGHRALQWSGKTGRLLAIAVGAVLVLGVSGAITALGDTLFPSSSLQAGFQADFSSASPLFLRVRVWHGVLAVLTAGYLVTMALSISRTAAGARRIGSVLIALAGLQVVAGALNLWLLAPVWMQLVHLLLADLLWIALVLFSAAALEKRVGQNLEAPKLTAA
jgi:heme A synthase